MIPFFSIIIPVYNIAPYLRECLDSVLAQTFTDWEAICVDDGSADGSGEILDEYAARDSRFRVIHQHNAGVSSARNAGLKMAVSGNGYVWFVDGDDAIHPAALKYLHDCFISNPTASSLCIMDDVINAWHNSTSTNKWMMLAIADSVRSIGIRDAASLKAHRVAAFASIIDRQIAKRLRFKEYSIGEDVLFLQEFYWSSPGPWLLTNEPLYFYRYRVGSAVNSAVSSEKVRSLLSTEKLILEMLFSNRDNYDLDLMMPYLDWNRDFEWQTFNYMLFRLPDSQSICAEIPLWLEVQALQQKLRPENFYRKSVTKILTFFNSAWLLRVLVLGPLGILRQLEIMSSVRKCYRFMMRHGEYKRH